jgi:hypothetical protein
MPMRMARLGIKNALGGLHVTLFLFTANVNENERTHASCVFSCVYFKEFKLNVFKFYFPIF